jgi:hypothetical protein
VTELRPEEPDYPARLRLIRTWLDEGLAVYVDHCEFGTSKKMVLVRASALVRAGSFPPVYTDYLLVTWIESGSMWYPMDIRPNFGYIAEKLQISRWPGDAKSIAAFLWNLSQMGTGVALVTAKEME